VVRINSPYWIPSGEEWVFISPDVNATLLNIRDMVKQKVLYADLDKVVWTGITDYQK